MNRQALDATLRVHKLESAATSSAREALWQRADELYGAREVLATYREELSGWKDVLLRWALARVIEILDALVQAILNRIEKDQP